jgi:DNA recombination protein RmuC
MIEAIEIQYIYAAAGCAVGLLLAIAFFLPGRLRLERQNAGLVADLRARDTAQGQMDTQFKLTAQEAVQNAHESFLKLAEARLKDAQKDGAHDLEKRQKAIDELVKPVHQNLEALGKALEQVKGTDTALRADLQNLSRETAKLVGAMRDPSAQGHWGEFILEGILEKSGLIRDIHYETQVSLNDGRHRPDVVINMQDGFKIAVDAKAPINEFAARLGDTMSEEENSALMQSLARQVREHAKKLGAKNYWENLESVDFVVMFLPSEHIYSIALRADPQLVDIALQNGVIIASPTLLMSLLRVVSVSWRQVELAKNAQEISDRGLDLYNRLLVFTGHIEKIGKGLQSAMGGYDAAVGSLEKNVLPAAREFKDLQALSNVQDLPELATIEETPRALRLTSADEQAKKRA